MWQLRRSSNNDQINVHKFIHKLKCKVNVGIELYDLIGLCIAVRLLSFPAVSMNGKDCKSIGVSNFLCWILAIPVPTMITATPLLSTNPRLFQTIP